MIYIFINAVQVVISLTASRFGLIIVRQSRVDLDRPSIAGGLPFAAFILEFDYHDGEKGPVGVSDEVRCMHVKMVDGLLED